ncbi:MAG TPA: sulfatase-like hydrolase/transferase [Chthonomonadaceae bacterium]|nr:sulfatase-like hydrolase/transferase [Chthonomonadaceae bacterium]
MQASKSSPRPNILLITSDQQHWSTLAVANPRISTPSLDRLCRGGTRFTRAYCPSPVCSPSRASIITGQYPAWHGCWTIGVKLDEAIPTVGDALGAAGYDTALIGKAHFQPLATDPAGGQESLECQPALRDLEFWRGFHGPWYGFQHVEVARNHADESHAGQHYALWLEERGLTNWRDYFQSWPPDPNAPERRHSWKLPQELHYSAWTAERSIAAIDRSAAAERPFFLWSSFHDPHPPYLVPEPWASMYDPADMEPGTLLPGELDRMPPHFAKTQEARPDFSAWRETAWANHGFSSHRIDDAALRKNMAVYYGMISFMDQQIGRILDRLDALGIADNTLVVFSTDHGHFLGQHGLTAKGAFHYEDLIRLPFLVRWPGGGVPPGEESRALQNLVDLAPTFLSAAGLAVPGLMQGIDQSAVWAGSAAPARTVSITEFRHQPTAIHLRTYVTERYKVTAYRDRPYGELFDLAEDPEERRNLWDEPSATALRAEMTALALNAEIAREPMRYPRIAHA